jgi:hypothetical protein
MLTVPFPPTPDVFARWLQRGSLARAVNIRAIVPGSKALPAVCWEPNHAFHYICSVQDLAAERLSWRGWADTGPDVRSRVDLFVTARDVHAAFGHFDHDNVACPNIQAFQCWARDIAELHLDDVYVEIQCLKDDDDDDVVRCTFTGNNY